MKTALKNIEIHLAENWRQTYSRTCRYINNRVAIKIICATHWFISESWGTQNLDKNTETSVEVHDQLKYLVG